jgi:iron complex outermembrane receptor protein
MLSRKNELFGSVAVLALCLLDAGAASAQSAQAANAAPADQVEQVTVTAQKREQNLQSVPIAVSAFNADRLTDQATHSITDLTAMAPNVSLQVVGAYPYASTFFIRGLGFADVESTYEPAVGVEVNGVYLARNSGATTDFFDINSVEILRGPQGTLYGRNTIGGVVDIQTKQPTGVLDGEAMVTGGDNGRLEFRGAVDFPSIDDQFAARLSILTQNYDGYWYNTFDHSDVGGVRAFSGRATFAWTPVSNFNATLVLDGDRERDTGSGFTDASLPFMVLSQLGYPASKTPAFQVNEDGALYQDFNNYGAALTANWNVGFATVTSVTGLRTFEEKAASDYDASPIPFFNALRDQTHHQISEELRLASSGTNLVDYVFGVYYLHQRYHITNSESGLVFGGLTVPENAGQANDAYAAFGQVDYHATDKLTFTAGGRYSYETKDFTIQPLFYTTSESFSHNWGDFSPKFVVSYDWTPNLMTYVQYSQGFRSGGFDGRAASFQTVGPYESETVDSYEAGVKSQWLDNRLRLNGDVFWSDYSNMQLGTQEFVNGTYQAVTKNAGRATIDGAELEADAVVFPGLTLNADLGFLDARFNQFTADLTGTGVVTNNAYLPLPYAPKWSGSVGATYLQQTGFGTLDYHADVTYSAKQFTSFSVYNGVSDFALRQSVTLIDLAVTWSDPDDRWNIGGWVKNLGNVIYQNNTFDVGPLMADRIYAAPRTWGVSVGVKF